MADSDVRGHDGLTTDLEHLMLRFVRTESVRYEQFSQIWREMNFTMIYSGLKRMENKKEFIQSAFHQAIMYVFPPFDFQRRIGGLYLLYGLYFTQTHRPRLKIRISPEQWKQLQDLYEEIKTQGHLDAMYIFIKLRSEKAFTYVAYSTQLVYTRTRRGESQEKWLAENQRDIEETFPNDLLTQLHKTHLDYQEMKSALALDEKDSLKLVDNSIAEYIINRLQNIQESEEERLDHDEVLKRMSQHKAARIDEIKSKSFGTAGNVSTARRHILTEVVSSATSSDERMPQSPRRGPGRRRKEKVVIHKPTAFSVFPKKLKQFELSDSEDESKETEPATQTTNQEDTKTKSPKQKKKKKDKKEKKEKKKQKKKMLSSKDTSDKETIVVKGEKSPKKTPKEKKPPKSGKSISKVSEKDGASPIKSPQQIKRLQALTANDNKSESKKSDVAKTISPMRVKDRLRQEWLSGTDSDSQAVNTKKNNASEKPQETRTRGRRRKNVPKEDPGRSIFDDNVPNGSENHMENQNTSRSPLKRSRGGKGATPHKTEEFMVSPKRQKLKGI